MKIRTKVKFRGKPLTLKRPLGQRVHSKHTKEYAARMTQNVFGTKYDLKTSWK